MKLEADFSEISSSFEPLEEGEYTVKITDIKEGETRANKLPQVTFELEVQEGPSKGRKILDFVVLKTNEGKRNDIGYGRVKAYAEATLGKEAAAGSSIDTDELKGNVCSIVVKKRTYKDATSGEEKTSSDVKKVLPVG